MTGLALLLTTLAAASLGPRVFHAASLMSIRPPAGFSASVMDSSEQTEGFTNAVIDVREERESAPSRIQFYPFADNFGGKLSEFVSYVISTNVRDTAGLEVKSVDQRTVSNFAAVEIAYGPVPEREGWRFTSIAFGGPGAFYLLDLWIHESRLADTDDKVVIAAVDALGRFLEGRAEIADALARYWAKLEAAAKPAKAEAAKTRLATLTPWLRDSLRILTGRSFSGAGEALGR